MLVCTVLRDGDAIAPDGNFVLRENDRIFVTAPSNNLSMPVSYTHLTLPTKRIV